MTERRTCAARNERQAPFPGGEAFNSTSHSGFILNVSGSAQVTLTFAAPKAPVTMERQRRWHHPASPPVYDPAAPPMFNESQGRFDIRRRLPVRRPVGRPNRHSDRNSDRLPDSFARAASRPQDATPTRPRSRSPPRDAALPATTAPTTTTAPTRNEAPTWNVAGAGTRSPPSSRS
ncbi:hypothetical protein N7509_013667 [Penicillium cosmopolitanum]|uniref:Uncharacterized protein n=1 Tax=Penicillium cosmopolitanum TaxID=1131564 RepID=A0A9W9VEU8_9EURO|nr:uncharacterized protein N7509_013667 [Penicillium cosmopolitanum]KAJ5376781.1 hypothetical protein N7509_013667 [Penicillium cosmopolitanum]